jgi:hypothetical protein
VTRRAPKDDIGDRIDVALEKIRWQRMGVRTITLAQEDLDELDEKLTRAFNHGVRKAKRCAVKACAYGGHFVRLGPESIVYSDTGEAFKVPQRLSRRVKAPK